MQAQASDGAQLSQDDMQALEKLKSAFSTVRSELAKVIVGQDLVIEQLLIAIFSQGHVLLEGVPGLAKTLMVSTLARSLKLDFNRCVSGKIYFNISSFKLGKSLFRFNRNRIFSWRKIQ